MLKHLKYKSDHFPSYDDFSQSRTSQGARATCDPSFISASYVYYLIFFQSLTNQEKVFPQQLTDSGPLQGAGHNKVGATLR